MARLVAPEAWRQSRIAAFNDCPLSLRFNLEIDYLRQMPGEMGNLGARGVLAHRVYAAAVHLMREHGEEEIGVDQALELTLRVAAQRETPIWNGRALAWEPIDAEDVVHLPMEELRWLRVLVTRWARLQSFSIQRVVDVERRLYADIEVPGPGGESYTRSITGQPDVLMAGPGQFEATMIDWKTGNAPPPRKKEPKPGAPEEDDKLSDMGYVQQVVYGWLIMKNYPSIQRVTQSEYYVMAKEDPVREASVERWEMERIEDILATQVSQMDAAVEEDAALRVAQAKARKAGRAVPMGRFFPIPGTHCGWCPGRRLCPTRRHFGVPTTEKEAERLAREWYIAGQIRSERIPYVKGWVENHGPIPIAHAKGRRVVGFKTDSGILAMYEPEEIPDSPFDSQLRAVAEESGVLIRD